MERGKLAPELLLQWSRGNKCRSVMGQPQDSGEMVLWELSG